MMTVPPHVRLAALATGGTTLLVYLLTLAPSVAFIDAGELAAVAHTFGVAHPTGYPLFTLLAGVWARLPLGDEIVRLNLLSAVWTAVAAGILVPLFWTLLGLVHARRSPRASDGRAGRGKGKGAERSRVPSSTDRRVTWSELTRLISAVGGALVAAFGRTFWSTGTAIEVYALHLVFLALLPLLFVRAEFDDTLDDAARLRRRLLFALVLGLSFTNHMTTVLLAPALLVVFFWRNGLRGSTFTVMLRMAPAFFAGLLPYLYLPIRAMAGPALVWGNPDTLQRFWWHVTGKQYSTWMFSGGEVAKKQLAHFFDAFPVEFAWVALLPMLLGVVVAFLRHRQIGTLLVLAFAGCVLYAINYDIHDIDSYFLLAHVAAAGFFAFGAAWIGAQAERSQRWAVAAVPVVVAGVMTATSWSAVSERGNHLVEDYTRNLFRSLKPNALVMSFQWDYWVSASYYYQLVLGERPDVVVIDKELLRRGWYLDQLQRMYPEVMARSRAEIEAFRVELGTFERGETYAGEVIEARFNAMIDSFFERNYRDRPVYVTIEIEQHLAAAYVRVPEGLAFRLYRPGDVPPPVQPVWDDFSFRPFHRGGRLIDGVLAMYASMLVNRGVYLARAGLHQQADPYFDRALTFVPNDRDALLWRERNRAALALQRGGAGGEGIPGLGSGMSGEGVSPHPAAPAGSEDASGAPSPR